MIKIYRTDDKVLHQITEYWTGSWIQLTNPTEEESCFLLLLITV